MLFDSKKVVFDAKNIVFLLKKSIYIVNVFIIRVLQKRKIKAIFASTERFVDFKPAI
jgi:hypothetical protein